MVSPLMPLSPQTQLSSRSSCSLCGPSLQSNAPQTASISQRVAKNGWDRSLYRRPDSPRASTDVPQQADAPQNDTSSVRRWQERRQRSAAEDDDVHDAMCEENSEHSDSASTGDGGGDVEMGKEMIVKVSVIQHQDSQNDGGGVGGGDRGSVCHPLPRFQRPSVLQLEGRRLVSPTKQKQAWIEKEEFAHKEGAVGKKEQHHPTPGRDEQDEDDTNEMLTHPPQLDAWNKLIDLEVVIRNVK